MDFVTLLSPNLPGTILGFSPTFIFPTATNYNIGQGKFQVGRRQWWASSPRIGWA